MKTLLELKELSKIYPSGEEQVYALNQISLSIRQGEFVAIVGQSGSGKSTLMNILSGLLQPTDGQIYMNGQAVNIANPTVANNLHIGMVHQHFMLVEAFTVAENINLGSEITKNGVLDIARATREINELSERYGLAVDTSAKVADISVVA